MITADSLLIELDQKNVVKARMRAIMTAMDILVSDLEKMDDPKMKSLASNMKKMSGQLLSSAAKV